MKKMVKLLICIFTFVPLIINARVNYEDAAQYTNHYIYNFEEYNDYIYLKSNTPYEFDSKKNIINSKFTSGGFLSKAEYEISNIKGNSYLSNGLQYWTLTKSSHQKHYMVDYKLLEQLDTNLSGVRITEYTKPDVAVSGLGTYSNPWTFDDMLSIHINSDNKYIGKVSTVECSNEEMRKESIHLNVVGDKARAFYVCPEPGYKFLKSTCSQYITNHNLNNMYTVENLDRDNVICKIYYSYETKKITAYGCSSCATGNTDRILYVNNTHKIWLLESDGINKIETINDLPTKKGYTFKGYYTSDTNFSEDNKVIESNGKLTYNNQLTSKDQLYPYMKANEYTIKYSCNNGTGATEQSEHTYDEKKSLTSNECTRQGYKFEGWSTSSTGSKAYSDNQEVLNLTDEDGKEITLYAVWTQCPAGTYGSDGLTCTKCPAGTYNSSKGSKSIDACQKCIAGTYSGKGASSCTQCSKGYYASGTGSIQCTICPVGTYAANTGSTSCTNCAAGTYNPNTGSTSATACIACPKGQKSTAGASSCTKCPIGTYASNTGSTQCTTCPVGTYAASTGSSACTNCVAGTSNPYTGSTSSAACTNCAKGYYSNSGSKECTKCPAGTYASSTGSSSCTSCGSGYTSPAGSDSKDDCYVATSLPTFTYTGKYELVTDSDAVIASGNGTTPSIPDTYKTYTGNWKLRLLSKGNLTINSLPNASKIDAYLVGGGQGGYKGDWNYTGSATYYTTSSGGSGGYRKTYTGISINLGVSYAVYVGSGGSSSGKAGEDSTITIGSNIYKASSGTRSGVGKAGGNEFDSTSYSKKYGGGGGTGCQVYSYSSYTCSGGSGKDGGGNSGSSGWSPNSSGVTCRDNKGIVSAGGNGKANTGGGGGGGGAGCGSYELPGGTGGSGIVIIRNAR